MKTVEFTSQELKNYFLKYYSYMSLELTDEELYYFTIGLDPKFNLESGADQLSDYLLANGLTEVQE